MTSTRASAGAVCGHTPPHFGRHHLLAGGVPAVGAGRQFQHDSSEVERGAHNASVAGSIPARATRPSVAQLDRARGFYPWCRGFESCRAGQSLVGGDKPTASLLQLTSVASASEGLCGVV